MAHRHTHTHTHTHTEAQNKQFEKFDHDGTKKQFKKFRLVSLKTILLVYHLLASTAAIIIMRITILLLIIMNIIIIIIIIVIIIIMNIIIIIIIIFFLRKIFGDYFDMSAVFLIYILCLIPFKTDLSMIFPHGCILIYCCIY